MTATAVGAATSTEEAGAAVHRRTELDALRGIAVALVVAAHVLKGAAPHYRGFGGWSTHGGLVGVQVFFALSGYLITGILLRGGGLGGFYRRRVQRLYPTLLVVTVGVLMWSGDVWSALRGLTYTENLVGGNHGEWTMSHTWSLAVEEQFYLVWPVLLLVFRRHAVKVAVVGIAATWWAQSFAGWSEHAVYIGLRWDAILAGCLVALMGWRGDWRVFTLAAGMLAVGCFVPVGYPLLTVASAALVASVPTGLNWRPLVHLGLISYPLYLWHVAALRLPVPAIVGLGIGLVLAETTYRIVDRRAQLGRRTEVLRPPLERAVGARGEGAAIGVRL